MTGKYPLQSSVARYTWTPYQEPDLENKKKSILISRSCHTHVFKHQMERNGVSYVGPVWIQVIMDKSADF